MSLARDLCALALEPLLEGACRAIGFAGGEGAVKAVGSFLLSHFGTHTGKVEQALRVASERAWKALELALEGDSFWSKCKGLWAQADQKAFAHQVRTFLDNLPLVQLRGHPDELRQACLQNLRDARKAGLLDIGQVRAGDVAGQVSYFARFRDPQQRAQEGLKLLTSMGAELKARGFVHLAWLMNAQAAPGSSLLVTAVRFFFRREVETNQELWQGLAWATWQNISEAQQLGFACLSAALVQHGKRLEEILAGTHRVALDILTEVKGQKAQIAGIANMVQQLLAEHRLDNRELRPQDSFSIRSPEDQNQVKQLTKWFRSLPKDQQARLPALLNGLGKLQHAAGDFTAAQALFSEVASVTPDAKAKAEASYNAYLSAVEKRDWPAALPALRRAAELDPDRFQPFQMAKYEPLHILGAGGFGVAFLCRHRISGGLRVLKTLRVDSLTSEVVRRIELEAKAMEGLHHEAIITLHDCDYADTGQTRLYLAMEHFAGETLTDRVARHGPLDARDALEIARQIAAGLQAAHQRGIMHRDIKPANILVKQQGGEWKVKIIDFGLALWENAQQVAVGTLSVKAQATTVSEIAGTIDYAAPEQIGRLPGTPVDRRADIYGFGRTCCFALFGSPHPMGRDWRDLSKGVAIWLDACLEQLPNQRPPDFGAVLEGMSKIKIKKAPKAVKGEPALIVTQGQQPNAEYVLHEGNNSVGREGASIDLEDQEPPDVCYISREHCVIILSKGKLWIEDLCSANATYLNGARIKPGESHPLKAADVIQVGTVFLKVRA